jgi:hypothetical protein
MMEYDRKLNALLGDNGFLPFAKTKGKKPHRLEVYKKRIKKLCITQSFLLL